MNVDTIEMSRNTIDESKKFVKKETGQIVVQPPKDKDKQAVIYRCKNRKSGWIEYPPLNVVMKIFRKRLEYSTYYSRGLKFEPLEFRFSELEKKPTVGGKGCVEIKICGVPPEIKP